MKKILLLLFILGGFVPVHSQVSLEGDYEEEYYIIRVESKGPGTYSVFVDVHRADNYGGPMKQTVTVAAPREILRLKRENPTVIGRVGYRYWWIEGDVNGRRDTSFVYRLPYSEYKGIVRAYNMKSNRSASSPYIATAFRTDKKDTIYAARKGKVIWIEDNYHAPGKQEVLFSTDMNRVMVLHGDGTTADYLGVEKGGFLVREGDTVYPDTPIAIAGPFATGGYGFYFAVAYPVLTGVDDKPLGRHYYTPVFATQDGGKTLKNSTVYVAKVTEELITHEMTGREKKNYEKRKMSASAKK